MLSDDSDRGNTLAGFAVTGIFGALYFLGDVPRVRKDILEKVPIIGPYWHREIAPEDNVRCLISVVFQPRC